MLNEFGYGAAADLLASQYGSAEVTDAKPFFGIWTTRAGYSRAAASGISCCS